MAYFPNGTAGMILQEQCDECLIGRHQDAPCPVLLQSLVYNYDQCEKGQEKLKDCMNMTIDEKGQCQMKKVMDEYIKSKTGVIPEADLIYCNLMHDEQKEISWEIVEKVTEAMKRVS